MKIESRSDPPAYLTPVLEALAPANLRALREDVRALRTAAADYEGSWLEELERVDPAHRSSARNLLHYLSLRHHDVREVQAKLAWVGLSSIGRAESHVLVTLDRIDGLLTLALGEQCDDGGHQVAPVGFREGRMRLEENTRAVLGGGHRDRPVRIMVTLPTEAASDHALVENLVAAGMDSARINLAHDGPNTWRAMVENVRRAARARSRDVRILMDLPGPKMRTGRVAGDGAVRVREGDHIRLVDSVDRHPVVEGDQAAVIEGPVAFLRSELQEGDPVLIDDSKLAARFIESSDGGILLEVTRAKAKGTKLRPEKGINLPGRARGVSALTGWDRQLLRFAAEQADGVSLSFVRSPEDVDALLEAIAERGRSDLGVVLKIETVEGFENLPRLLLRAMRNSSVGVMIARGDLAAEVGFERLAEVQEEILWIAEAAHVPTIWATQVLEQLAKTGMPSRAEVTDAAMSVRAEAVMLNKGPHVVEAIRTLDDILRRMQHHQFKKLSLLRPLDVSVQEDPARHTSLGDPPSAPA